MPHQIRQKMQASPRSCSLKVVSVCIAFTCAWHTSAVSSDAPTHSCQLVASSPDFEFDPETNALRKQSTNVAARFSTIDRKRLRHVLGFCNAKGRRYRFSTEVYGLTLQFVDNGTRLTKRFRCTKSEDATPAGLNCDREIRMIDWRAPSSIDNRYR
jgi:hypothetical protein